MNDHNLPVAPEAEAAVIGAILNAGRVPDDLDAVVQPDDFFNPHWAEVYRVALELAIAGKPCTVPAVMAKLDAAQVRALRNGIELGELLGNAPVAGNAAYYGEIVANHATRRRYIEVCYRIAHAAREGDEALDDYARTQIDSVPRATVQDDVDPWEVIAGILAPEKAAPGFRYGFPDLDNVLPPMRPGQMTAIGARSGVGKSTLAVDIGRDVAYRQGGKVLMVSLEMDVEQIYKRMLAAEAKVKFEILNRGGELAPFQKDAINSVLPYVGGDRLVVVQVPDATVADIRRLVRHHKPDVTIVDYIGRVQLPRADRHDLAVSAVSRGLSLIGQTEHTHMIVLSQLNRKGDSRNDKTPNNGDLRDSAGLEHDADVILLGHRPDKVDPDDRPGEVDWWVTKNRQGKADIAVTLAAQLHYSRFWSMAREYPTPAQPVTDITEPIHHQDVPA